MKNTKKNLILSLICVLLTITTLIGSTFAWFTDSVSNTGNRIQAGNLDVDLLMYKDTNTTDDKYASIAEGNGDIFKEADYALNSNVTLWEPGKSQWVYLAIKNNGSLALKYTVSLNIKDEDGYSSMVQDEQSALEYAIIPGLKQSDNVETLLKSKSWDEIKTYALEQSNNEATNAGDVTIGTFKASGVGIMDEIANGTSDETQYFLLAVHMKEEADNKFQDARAIIDITVDATQYTAEEDGFGNNQYDEIITYEINCYPTNCIASIDNPSVIRNGEIVTLTFTAEDGYEFGDFYSISSNVPYDYSHSDDLKTATVKLSNPTSNIEMAVEATAAGACFAAGTKITMADGSVKNIEDIEVGDKVLTFNHESNEYEGQDVFIAYHGEYRSTPFTLHFENGNTVSIVGEHDLFEKESCKYVTIYETSAEQFIGKHFYSAADGRYLELIDVTYETEPADFYSLYISYNKNCIANGMLSLPSDIDYILNFYEFNEDLTADLDVLAADFEKYGIFVSTHPEMYNGDNFNVLGCKYLNIIVGKGLVSWEELYSLLDYYHNNY